MFSSLFSFVKTIICKKSKIFSQVFVASAKIHHVFVVAGILQCILRLLVGHNRAGKTKRLNKTATLCSFTAVEKASGRS